MNKFELGSAAAHFLINPNGNFFEVTFNFD